MNYEDRGIDESYEQKEADRAEMPGLGLLLVVVLLAAAVVFMVAEAIKGMFN